MKVLKDRRSGLRSLLRGGLVILSVFALAFAVSCGDSNNNDTPGPGPGPGPEPEPPPPPRVVTALQILDQPAPRTVHFEGQQPTIDGVRVRLQWSSGSPLEEVITINAENRNQFNTAPRFILSSDADAFDTLHPNSAFTTGYNLLHITQVTPLAGQELRIGIIKQIADIEISAASELNERNPIQSGTIDEPFFEDRLLLNDADLFNGFTVQVLYDPVEVITGGPLAGVRIPGGHQPVRLSAWNLNEQAIDLANEEIYTAHTGFANSGNIGPFFMGLQHRQQSRGWMHLVIGDGARAIRFPVNITLFPVMGLTANQTTGNWGDHFQFMNSVPTTWTGSASDWWIDEIFERAGFTFTVLYAHTDQTQQLTFTQVRQARGRGLPQAQLMGGIPNFFVNEVDEILARVGWFSATQLDQHANPGSTFPNQVVDLRIPVWAFEGDPVFIDKPAHAVHQRRITVEGAATSTSGPLPVGAIEQVWELYDLVVHFTMAGDPRSPFQVPVNEFIWNEGTAANFFSDGGPRLPANWGNINRYNITSENIELELGWTFPTGTDAFAASPFDHAHFSGARARFNFNPDTVEARTSIRTAFAGIGTADFPREALLLPWASPTN